MSKGNNKGAQTFPYKDALYTLKELSALSPYNLGSDTIRRRIISGMSVEEAVDTPSLRNGGNSEWDNLR